MGATNIKIQIIICRKVLMIFLSYVLFFNNEQVNTFFYDISLFFQVSRSTIYSYYPHVVQSINEKSTSYSKNECSTNTFQFSRCHVSLLKPYLRKRKFKAKIRKEQLVKEFEVETIVIVNKNDSFKQKVIEKLFELDLRWFSAVIFYYQYNLFNGPKY